MTASPDSFGTRLRQLRVERGLSQAQLAADGISPSYVSLLEAGKRRPTKSVIEQLAGQLHVAVELLAEGIDPRGLEELELELRYAELALVSGEAREALDRFRRVVESDPIRSEALRRARVGEAKALEATGKLEDAVRAYEQLVQEGPAASGDADWLRLVIATCRCYRELGDLGRSIDLGEAVRARIEELGLAGTEVGIELVATLEGAYWERGDLVRAQLLIESAIAAAEQLGSRHARGAAYWNASLVAHERGRTAEAVGLAERALALFGEGSDERNLARLRTAYAWLLMHQRPPRPEQAMAQLERAAEQLAETGSEVDAAYCQTEQARAYLQLGDAHAAVTMATESLARLSGSGPLETARARLVLGAAEFARGNESAAVAAYELAARELNGVGAQRQAAGVWRELAEMFSTLGRSDAALDAYRRAADCAAVPAPAVWVGVGERVG